MVVRKRWIRKAGTRRYRNRLLVATEGSMTEPQYFKLLNSRSANYVIDCISSGTKSSPNQVLKRMRKRQSEATLRPGDAAWIVIDKDNWNDEQLKQLFE